MGVGIDNFYPLPGIIYAYYAANKVGIRLPLPGTFLMHILRPGQVIERDVMRKNAGVLSSTFVQPTIGNACVKAVDITQNVEM